MIDLLAAIVLTLSSPAYAGDLDGPMVMAQAKQKPAAVERRSKRRQRERNRAAKKASKKQEPKTELPPARPLPPGAVPHPQIPTVNNPVAIWTIPAGPVIPAQPQPPPVLECPDPLDALADAMPAVWPEPPRGIAWLELLGGMLMGMLACVILATYVRLPRRWP